MATGPAIDAHERAQRALDELKAYGLEPSATNIALWTTHLAGECPELSNTITTLTSNSERLTDATLQALYVEHLLVGVQETLDMGGVMSEQLQRAAEALAQADRDATRYGAALEGASSALRSPIGTGALQSLVANLMQATEQMRERTRRLETRLAETSGEVSSLRDNLSRVREEALTDPLTGAANRKRFDERLEEACREAMAQATPLCLVMCDIDHFKTVNDTWGHNTGDQVIRFIASALQQAAGDAHLVARHGGEEFSVVAAGLTIEEAAAIAEQARTLIESKVLRRRTTNEKLGSVTASFGVAQYAPGEARWQLLERADAALYTSKSKGRNRVTCAAPLKAAS